MILRAMEIATTLGSYRVGFEPCDRNTVITRFFNGGYLCYLKTGGPMKRLLVCLTLACTSCAGNKEPLPVGPDTYTLSEREIYVAGGSDRAQEIVLGKANAHCESMGRKFAPTVMRPTWNGIPGYEVAYSCLLPGDPRLANWSVGQLPNAVVEQRIR
jgi:hypothetical protein